MILSLIFESLRPRQWTKNFFIFAGILFSKNIFNGPLFLKSTSAFFIFCLFSGSVYILNDLFDLEEDKRHPVKSRRAMASGRLKPGYGLATLLILIPLSLYIAYRFNLYFFLASLAYLLLQLVYSLFLKHIVILDALVVASGFFLRVVVGAVVVEVEMSSWLLICTIFLSLFLALSKRRCDLLLLGGASSCRRNVLGKYNTHLLDQMIAIVTAATLTTYGLYTISSETVAKFGTRNLIFTIPFVLYGVFRYLYLVYQKGEGGIPEDLLLRDSPLLVNIFLWVISVVIILYEKI